MNKKVIKKELSCQCCEVDEKGNWLHDPCCKNEPCEAALYSDTNDGAIALCIHCGAEMFKENGSWYHNSQRETRIENRNQTHYGP